MAESSRLIDRSENEVGGMTAGECQGHAVTGDAAYSGPICPAADLGEGGVELVEEVGFDFVAGFAVDDGEVPPAPGDLFGFFDEEDVEVVLALGGFPVLAEAGVVGADLAEEVAVRVVGVLHRGCSDRRRSTRRRFGGVRWSVV